MTRVLKPPGRDLLEPPSQNGGRPFSRDLAEPKTTCHKTKLHEPVRSVSPKRRSRRAIAVFSISTRPGRALPQEKCTSPTTTNMSCRGAKRASQSAVFFASRWVSALKPERKSCLADDFQNKNPGPVVFNSPEEDRA
jgi:hypothetical protein